MSLTVIKSSGITSPIQFGNVSVSGKGTFTGSTTSIAMNTTNLAETVTINASAVTGTLVYAVTTQTVYYITASSSANFELSVIGSDMTTLDSLLSVGQSISIAVLVTNGASAYYINSVLVDGSAPAAIKWLGGTAPSAGTASSIDSYTFAIIKTASNTFTVLGSLAAFG